ncbi:MAG: NAD-dependent succinate-semialdehyde dehydrogenase [Bacteroidetes bacterium]|nr:NAD-dependent succinate-semialdehyde dehydrogenase [Bacteroidota bacterium]
MKYQSMDPYTGRVIRDFALDSFPDLAVSQHAFAKWRRLSIAERGVYMRRLAAVLDQNKEPYARLITQEMGKPYKESLYEINKVLTAFDYYIAGAEQMLAPEIVATNAAKSYITFEPLGIIFSVMPWNFPFWQVFRFAVPSLMAGNVTILKHAPSVSGCAEAIEQAFAEAGMPYGTLLKYYLSNEDAAKVIAHPAVRGVSFTGSDATGSVIASLAGRHIKKAVIELGGNDPFIILPGADMDMAVAGALKSRSINSGQSCNAAKRFIAVGSAYEVFSKRLIAAVKALKVGNPMDEDTQIGPLARPDLADKVRKQIADTVAQGAKVHSHDGGGIVNESFVPPVVLDDVRPGMVAFEEEVFGPVWSMVKADTVEEALVLANQSQYGLGASVWTGDAAAAERWIPALEAGNVFINDIVKSDARLPFGGVKRSGFGRELSEFGLREFVNVKTVYIK